LIAGAIGISAPAFAQENSMSFAGDRYTSGQDVEISSPVTGDVFMAGFDVDLAAPVAGNAHVAGYNVSVDASVAGNLYAAGYSISVAGVVGGNLTAAANRIVVESTSPVAGNVRLTAAEITLSRDISGSALISAHSLNFNSRIDGDLNFFGETLTFGPNATVTGTVTIQAPGEIAVPVTVADADRVSYSQVASPDYLSEAGRTAESVFGEFWPQFWAAMIALLALFLLGFLLIAFAPRGIAALEAVSSKRPLRTFGIGILVFAAILGLTPVLVLTVVGILLLPIALVFALVASGVAFLGGTYLVGALLAQRFVAITTNVHRAVLLAVSLVVTAALGMIPILGWPIILTLVFFGFGVIALWLSGGRFDRASRTAPNVQSGPMAPAPLA
jgi:cytoskeletal protein CcmA (bactofilin family)